MVPPDIPGGSVDTLRAATDIFAERRIALVRRGFRGRRLRVMVPETTAIDSL
jgi:hypothetical protein